MGDDIAVRAKPRVGRIYRRDDVSKPRVGGRVNVEHLGDGITADLVLSSFQSTTGAVVSSGLWDRLREHKQDIIMWMHLGGHARIKALGAQLREPERLRKVSGELLGDLDERFDLGLRWVAEEAVDKVRCVPTSGDGVSSMLRWLYRRFVVAGLDSRHDCIICPEELRSTACAFEVCPLLLGLPVEQSDSGWPVDCRNGVMTRDTFTLFCAWLNVHTLILVCSLLAKDFDPPFELWKVGVELVGQLKADLGWSV